MNLTQRPLTSEMLAERTKDAHSFARYGIRFWKSCIEHLANRGLDATEIEEVVRSKHMRWFMDGCSSANAKRDKTVSNFKAYCDRNLDAAAILALAGPRP